MNVFQLLQLELLASESLLVWVEEKGEEREGEKEEEKPEDDVEVVDSHQHHHCWCSEHDKLQ